MTDVLAPDAPAVGAPGPVPVKPPSLEFVLAQQANDAILKGADPHVITDNLGTMLRHLRANPDLATSGADALAKGADPTKMASVLWSRSKNDVPYSASLPTPAPTMYDGSPAKAGVVQEALQGATGGFGDEIAAGADAGIDALKAKVTGKGDFGKTFNDAYSQNVTARRQALAALEKDHPVGAGIAQVGGGLTTALAGGLLRGGAAAIQAVPEAEAVPALVGRTARGIASKIAAGIGTGVATGAVYGAGNAEGSLDNRLAGAGHGAVTGGIFGGAAPILTGVAGNLINRTPLPGMASRALSGVADALPDVLGNPLQRFANSFGPKGAAAATIASRDEMDRAAGFVPNDVPQGVTPIALHSAGPNLEGLAEGIANRPGQGKTTLIRAIGGTQEQMRPAIAQAFDQGTGTTAESGEALLKRLADEHAAIDNASDVAKSVAADAAGKKPVAPMAPVDAWKQAVGGKLGDGMAQLQQLVDERSATGKTMYDAAREATKGQVVESPTLKSIMQTPTGKAAYNWAQARQANLIPDAANALEPADAAKLGSMFSPGQWADLTATAAKRGVVLPPMAGAEPVAQGLPNPETVHLMKRYLASVAKLGMNDGLQGKASAEATGAMSLWGKVRGELPESWQQADDAYAAKSRLIDQFNAGRNLTRTQLNPAGNAQQGLAKSLNRVQDNVEAASPEEQQAFRTGAQAAITDYFRSGGTGQGFAKQLQDPTSALSRRIALATGDERIPGQMAQGLAPQPHQLLAPPPIPTASATSEAAARGLNVLRSPVSPAGNAPQTALSNVAPGRVMMSLPEAGSYRQGAAQAVRGEFAGSGARSPGSVFASSPERQAQVAQAFPTPQAADAFQGQVGGWDRLQAQATRILGNSRTAGRAAEDVSSINDGTVNSLVTGRLGGAVRSLIGGISGDASNARRQAVDAEIAKILSSTNPMSLQSANQTALARHVASQVSARLSAGIASQQAVNHLPR